MVGTVAPVAFAVAAWTLALACMAAPAAAIDESQAAMAWRAEHGTGLVAGFSHDPAEVGPKTQFRFELRLDPAHVADVTEVQAQVCIVADLCLIPFHAGTQVGGAWGFDTDRYRDPVGGRPAQWTPGERVGVRFLLAYTNGTQVEFPRGMDLHDPGCIADWPACAETHYLAFPVADAAEGSPAPSLVLGPMLLAAAAVFARQRRA